MIQKGEKVKIICDKCLYSQEANQENYNEVFFESGWCLKSSARKYKHLCRRCQTKNERKAHDFVKDKFKIG